ncbi:MAG: hypothetical protein AAFX06_07455 [Planctomycetota bacterium]
MPKFYVQCGHLELVLTSDSADSAALAVIDRVLQPHLWIYDDPDLTEEDCRQHLLLEALLHLPTELRISERGFYRDDAMVVPVPETIQSWHALMIGMQRLFRHAGLCRTVSVLAGAGAMQSLTSVRRSPK